MLNKEKFVNLGIKKELLEVIEKEGFEKPTEIQEKVISFALNGNDIIGCSATGSGKTLAFATPIIQNIKSSNSPQSIILTPTRELAEQVSKAFRKFSKNNQLNIQQIYGGVNIERQIKNLQNADIVIGTPGRILDHLNRRTLNLRDIKILVLDEVDRMFDMGFQEDVEKIINECPKKRQTMLFSATISRDIDHLAKKHTQNRREISAKSYIDQSQLKQVYYDIPDGLKFSLLVHLLKKENSGLTMIFCSSRKNVDFIAKNLQNQNIHANPIHGGMPQNKRKKMLDDFHNKKVNILVCTDVAARGLDISGISHVYNYDIPKTSDEYIHRIGRTARAGKEGIAINLLSSRDYENFSKVRKNENLEIEKAKTPRVEKVGIKTEQFRKKPEQRRNFRTKRNTLKRKSNQRDTYNKKRLKNNIRNNKKFNYSENHKKTPNYKK